MKRLHKLLATSAFSLLIAYSATAQVSITTWQVNNQHTGNNNQETQLTPGNVGSPGNFVLQSYPQMDGQSSGQPLVVSGIHNGHDMVFSATQRCNIYGFDVSVAGIATPVWNRHLVPATVSSYVPVPQSQSGSGDISDVVGLTTTPVIDPATSTLYVVSKLYDPSGSASAYSSYHQYLYALDLLTGNPKLGSPVEITATFPNATGSDSVNGVITFNPLREHLRCAMTLDNGVLYLAYASHSDTNPYHGEVIGYSPSTLKVVKTFNTSPSNNEYCGLWNSGAGTAFDIAHNMFLSVANGTSDAPNGNWGDSVVKVSTAGATVPMTVDTSSTANWFTPGNWSQLNGADLDLGSGGLLLLPNESPSITNNKSLIVGGGKGAVLYVLDHDNLGGLTSNDSGALQEIASPGDWIFATPAYYNGNVYVAASGAALKQYKVAYNATDSTYLQLAASSSDVFNNRGATPFISSNGKTNGIVWAQTGSGVSAYDAANVSGAPIFSVNATVPPSTGCQNAKFSVPMVANGKMYFAAYNGSSNQSYLFVCGLLPIAAGAPAAASNAAAVALSASSTQVSWTDNSGGTAGFYVKRSTSASSGFNTVSGGSPLNAGTMSYVDTGLTASTPYYYQVVATNNAGDSNASNVAGVTTFPTYAENGLVAFYPLEEVESDTTSDVTGNGHDGSIPSGEGYIAQDGGYVNNGFHAHGTGQAVSRVVVPDDPALRFTAGQSFTLSAWVQPDATRGTEQTVIAKARDSSIGYYGIWLDGNGHWIGRGTGGDIVTTAAATAGVWTHVALVQDGTANTRKLYVNGVLGASGTAQEADGMGDLWMTQQNVSGNLESMPGNLDEVRLYNRALAAGEITNLMAPPVVEADSVLTHGSGASAVALPVSIWPAATRKTEPREAPSNSYKVAYTFATALQGGVTSSVGSVAADPNDARRVIVTLTSPNRATTNVGLGHILPSNAPAGATAGTATIPLSVLWGDVNGDSVVNALDESIETNSHAGTVGAGVARYDINLDGVIDSKDDALVSGAEGTNVGAQTETNLALYQPAYASSVTGSNTPALAVDGNTTGTRWESQYSDPQYMYVDLGVACTIHTVKLSWENAAGKTYTIDVSNDGLHPEVQNGSNWTRLATETNGGSIQTYPSTLTGTYRYVRMFGTTRTTGYGYSLWDFEVLGLSGSGGTTASAPVVSGGSASGTEGVPFSYQIAATNHPTSYGVTGLKAGLTVNAKTGVISGTPSAAGTYQMTLYAYNGAGTGSAVLNVNIGVAAPVITSAATASGTVGKAFSYQIAATNGATSYGVTGLKAGLTVNAKTGVISGTPTAAGTYQMTLYAYNSAGTGSAGLNVTVHVAPPVVTSGATASGMVGKAFSYQITASGNPTKYGVTGLKASLTVNATTGVISGTPTAAGTFQMTLYAYNGGGDGTATLTVTIGK